MLPVKWEKVYVFISGTPAYLRARHPEFESPILEPIMTSTAWTAQERMLRLVRRQE
jgi:hypothetical protein